MLIKYQFFLFWFVGHEKIMQDYASILNSVGAQWKGQCFSKIYL